MKTKFKYATLLTVASLLGFTACSSDDEVTGKTPETGTPTNFSLSISQPVTYAADPNATADEVTIKTVDVYIYDASNAFIKRQSLVVADFDDLGDNKWQLKDAKKIATTTGAKNIYVGVNLPATLATAIVNTDPGAAKQAITSAATELGNTTSGFAMFSRLVKTPTLVTTGDPDYATENTVTVTVARLLAKVVVQEGNPFSTSVTGGTVSGLQFAVSNVNKKFFPYPSSTFRDPNWTSPWSVLTDFIPAQSSDYKTINPNATAITIADAVYTTENTSQGNAQGDHTYVSVRATYTPSSIVKLNTAGDATSGFTADDSYNAGETFYLVNAGGQKYFFKSSTDAAAYATDKGTSAITYTNGLAYYNIFLNPAPQSGQENKFDVLRNNIYKVTITKINGLGKPGDIITDPTEEIDEPTDISVTLDIEPWTIVTQENEI